MAKRASGGLRATMARARLEAERAALAQDRGPDEISRRLEAARVEGDDPASVAAEAMSYLRECMRLAPANAGALPSQRIEQTVRAAAALAKVADPARQIAELANELRDAHAEIQELRERIRGASQPARDPAGSEARALQ